MAQHSKFLTLPAELRNHIYELSLPDLSEAFISRAGIVQPPALAQVCRQIRAEFASYLPPFLSNTNTLTFKAFDCDFRHVIKTYESLAGGDIDNLECLKFVLSFSDDDWFDWTLFTDLADTLFTTSAHPIVRRMVYRPWEAVAVVGRGRRRAIRHELIVDVGHTESDCVCSKLARERLYFPAVKVGSRLYDKIPSPREMLKNEMESALRMSHDQWVIRMVEKRAAEKRRVEEAVGELEVLMGKLKLV